MALSCPDGMLGAMKIIASVAALVLTGLLAGWLWLDATADVRGDTAGVAISGSVDPAAVTGGVLTPAPSEDAATTDAAATSDDVAITGTPAATGAAEDGLAAGVVSVLRASAGELVERAEETRAAEQKARKKAKEKKAVEVQPAPVNPGGWCEWDDDDGWECDDYDDDDDWDD